MIALLTACLFFCNPCARAELHQQSACAKTVLGHLKSLKFDLSIEYRSFSYKGKTTMLFPSPLTFLQWAMNGCSGK